MISPYQGTGLGGVLMLYREKSTGAWGFVDALNHELCSPSCHPVAADGGCMIKGERVASLRLLGFRTQAPPEYIPLIDPEPLTNLVPMDECPLEYLLAFSSDHLLVERLNTESPPAPQLARWKPTPSQVPVALPYMA